MLACTTHPTKEPTKQPTKQQHKQQHHKQHPPPSPAQSPWKVYLKNQWISILLNRTKLIYGFYTGLWYIIQFIGAVTVINLYSDKDRKILCPTILASVLEDNPDATYVEKEDKSSEVFRPHLPQPLSQHAPRLMLSGPVSTESCFKTN